MVRNDLSNDTKTIAHALFAGLATPVSLGVSLLLKYGEWDQIARKRVDPRDYTSHEAFWADYTAVSFLRKCQDLPTSFDRKANAIGNFWRGEADCFKTNLRLSRYLNTGLFSDSDDVVERFIVSARKKIAKILGAAPKQLEGRFGKGSTYGDRGFYATVPDKMSSRPTLTDNACSIIPMWSTTAWARACSALSRDIEVVKGNRFTTVTKDCEKDRGIAVEPSVNLFYQLAVGRLLKDKLKIWGLDLRFGQDIHRRVAREASITGHLCTIDLSNASDTVSLALVRLLLPASWFQILYELRSSHTLIDGKEVLLEKFSSMGNGYTFELETLLFSVLCSVAMETNGTKAVPGLNMHVFGDDIIVPSACARDVIAVLQYFGMKINKEKSFVEGPFRESCGGDFFLGVPVRPFFLEKTPSEPQEFIALANGIRRLASSVSFAYYRGDSIRKSWFSVLDAIPSHIRRSRGPEALGDLVIHDSPENWTTRVRGCRRYFKCYRPARFKRVGWNHFFPEVVLASALYGTGDGRLGVMPRDPVTGYKVGWVCYS